MSRGFELSGSLVRDVWPMTACGWFVPVWCTGYQARAGGLVRRGYDRPSVAWLQRAADPASRALGGWVFEVARAEAISASAAEDGQVGFGDAAGVVDEVDRDNLRAGDRARHE